MSFSSRGIVFSNDTFCYEKSVYVFIKWQKKCLNILSCRYLCPFFKKKNCVNCLISLLNIIKFYCLHYNLFTPKLRFFYSIKRFLATCYDKAFVYCRGNKKGPPVRIYFLQLVKTSLVSLKKSYACVVLWCSFGLKEVLYA